MAFHKNVSSFHKMVNVILGLNILYTTSTNINIHNIRRFLMGELKKRIECVVCLDTAILYLCFCNKVA